MSRRVNERLLRLRPGQGIDGVVGILFANAARRWGVVVAQLMVMSNHVHAVLWDPRGLVSDFLRDVMSGIACAANHEQGRAGYFWERDNGRSLLPICDVGALEDAVVYSYLNPVEAGLVARPDVWPGINTRIDDIGTERSVVFTRSKLYFREAGPVPMEAELCLGLPDGVDAEGFRARVRASVDRKLGELHQRAKLSGRRFLGVAAILAADIFSAPSCPDGEEESGHGAGGADRVAARDPELKRFATARLLEFERRYEECARGIARGERAGIVLPAGTYRLWRHRGFAREDEPVPERVFQAA